MRKALLWQARGVGFSGSACMQALLRHLRGTKRCALQSGAYALP